MAFEMLALLEIPRDVFAHVVALIGDAGDMLCLSWTNRDARATLQAEVHALFITPDNTKSARLVHSCFFSSIARFKWAEKVYGFERTARLFAMVVDAGCISVLRWLRAPFDGHAPCPWDERACKAAARNGHIGVLRWLRSPDVGADRTPCPWDERACEAAARNGHVDTLRFLHAPDVGDDRTSCPWGEFTCTVAAMNGRIRTLVFLRAPDVGDDRTPCPWDEPTRAVFVQLNSGHAVVAHLGLADVNM
jgi:hypothetical protein